jgi:hypothetical protein
MQMQLKRALQLIGQRNGSGNRTNASQRQRHDSRKFHIPKEVESLVAKTSIDCQSPIHFAREFSQRWR